MLCGTRQENNTEAYTIKKMGVLSEEIILT